MRLLFESNIGSVDILVFLLIAFYAFAQINALYKFEGLPSPFYGGDLYHQLGSVYHISQSGPAGWFSSSTFTGGLPHYFPLYGVYVSLFVWFFGFTPVKALLFSSVISGVFVPYVAYIIFSRIFNRKSVAAAGVIMFYPLSALLILKYTSFGVYLMTPLFAYALYRFFHEEASKKNALFLGLVFGLYSLTHGAGFFISVFFTGFFAFTHILSKCCRLSLDSQGIFIETEPVSRANINILKLVLVVFLVGFLIASPYWYKPIFVYKGVALNKIQEWAFRDLGNPKFHPFFVKQTIGEFLINFDGFYSIFKTVLSVGGIILLLDFNSNSSALSFVRRYFAASLLLSFSYLVTVPLGIDFTPVYIDTFTLGFSAVLLRLSALSDVRLRPQPRHLLLVLIVVLALFADASVYKTNVSKGWFGFSEGPLSPRFKGLQTYVLQNTRVNDVFLSTNELSFALNAVTGRKLLVNRRAHSGVFSDMDGRSLDAAIILYGNDTKTKLELIRKHGVKYVFWTIYWIRSEYTTVNARGEDVKWFDPLVLVYSKERERALQANGVDYLVRHTWLDPAIKGERVRKMDLIFVTSRNYRSRMRPWSGDLDDYLVADWRYFDNGKETAVVYRFNQTKISRDLASL